MVPASKAARGRRDKTWGGIQALPMGKTNFGTEPTSTFTLALKRPESSDIGVIADALGHKKTVHYLIYSDYTFHT